MESQKEFIQTQKKTFKIQSARQAFRNIKDNLAGSSRDTHSEEDYNKMCLQLLRDKYYKSPMDWVALTVSRFGMMGS
jgi:hypothetical protein